MEIKSPAPCPKTVTVRRNPPRRARPTPATAAPISVAPSPKISSAIRSFPLQDILSIDIPEKPDLPESSSIKDSSPSEKLKVFLRIKPIVTQQKVGASVKIGAQKNVWPQNPNKKKDASKMGKAAGKKKSEICLKMNDSHSVTLCPPQSLADARRTKSEVYEGFSHVFCAESSQSEVYETMVNPLVEDFLMGKSGMLAAMGPSGSGKTHTVFGSTREPGMVSLALRKIFSEKESNDSKSSRTFYLSMFEIYSERGKGEKMLDLSQEGGDLFMQQSNIKGLQETIIHDVQQAESSIASGMLKRSTAMTNSNIQSSRSQCIINIRSDLNKIDEDTAPSCTALLTIVDLAGAEREKRTGNQGARLLESNFINNTSMVFGLCLRSLLEHQKNPKKPFHKHFQNSLLTKYLRDFLEGKKRMSLILTAKSGEEDYQDTSYLLRQASPYMNIKFENVEEQPANAFGNKKRTHTLPKVEQSKRMKFNSNEVCMDDEVKSDILKEELTPEKVNEVEVIDVDSTKNNSIARENYILLNFSRAFWNVLKEYKNKLEASENEVYSLTHSLAVEKERSAALETELNLMKSSKEIVSTSLSVESFQERSNESDDVPYEYVVFDKEDLTELGEKEFSSEITGCDTFETAVNDSELIIQEDEISSFVQQQQKGEEGISSVEVVSISSDLEKQEEQCNEKADVSTTNVVLEKQELKEVEERETNGEIADFSVVNGDEVSSSLEEDQPKQKEKEGITSVEVVSISSDLEKCEDQCNQQVDVSDKQEFKEVEEREANEEIAGGVDSELTLVLEDEDQPKHEEKKQVDVSDKQEFKEVEERETNGEIAGGGDSEVTLVLEDEDHPKHEGKKDTPDGKLVCYEDVISSQGCNVSTLPESSNVQPCNSSSAVKPKRRLRPASSVMLRNINILDSIDATEMPKDGKRGGGKDLGGKRTQGSISLMRILKQNFHH